MQTVADWTVASGRTHKHAFVSLKETLHVSWMVQKSYGNTCFEHQNFTRTVMGTCPTRVS